VNITRSPHKGGTYLEYAKRSGNDKDNSVAEMTNFLFHCFNFKNGCTYTAMDVFQVDQHETNCKITEPVERPPTVNAKPFPCSIDDCKKAYNGQRELDTHFRHIHQSIKCYMPGCTEKKLFKGENALLVHCRVAHPAKGQLHPTIPDQKDAVFDCPVANCGLEFRRVVGKNNYRPFTFHTHLRLEHGMNNEKDREKLVPPWGGNPCFFPGCRSKRLFPGSKEGRADYKDHLMDYHEVEEDDTFEYSWARVRGEVLPARPNEDELSAQEDEMPVQEDEQPVQGIGTHDRPILLDDEQPAQGDKKPVQALLKRKRPLVLDDSDE
jgi:hypothetical protein